MSTTFDIKIPKKHYDKLNVRHKVQNLPLIEWVCTQMDIPVKDVDSSNAGCFTIREDGEDMILTVTTTNHFIKIIAKYEPQCYVITDELMEGILGEALPVINYVGRKFDEQQANV